MKSETQKMLAVDAGKYMTKSYALTPEGVSRKKCRTKYDEMGRFDDDMIPRGTFIAQIDDGPVYRIGYGAKNEPLAETSKKTEIHRIVTLAAAARMLGAGVHYNVGIAIGLPLDICEKVDERLSYKEYILGKPGVVHTVRLKESSYSDVVEVKFSFGRQLVYPEGIGALYKYPSLIRGPVGIIDIGHINSNCMYYNQFEPVSESCFTDEMGGRFLISELTGKLSAELGTGVDDNLVASTLMKPYEDRCLRSTVPGLDTEERSRAVIDSSLRDHVLGIRQRCRTRHWSIDFMIKIFIGGASKLLAREIKEVFGDSAVIIADDAEYVNAYGFLKMLCAVEGIDLDERIKKEAETDGRDKG